MDMATSAAALSAQLPAEESAEETLAQLTQEDIAARAYELWQQRGCPEGDPETDWFAAETELLG